LKNKKIFFNNFFPTIFPNYYNKQIKEEIINYQINLISQNFKNIKEKKDNLNNLSKEDILINNNLLGTYNNYIRKNGEFINFGDNYNYSESEDEKSESDSNGENNSKNTYPENESESENVHDFYDNISENDYDDYDNNNDYYEINKSNLIDILKKK